VQIPVCRDTANSIGELPSARPVEVGELREFHSAVQALANSSDHTVTSVNRPDDRALTPARS
jgi:hypothetical protein